MCDRPLTNLCQQGLAASWGASQQNARGRGGQSKLSKLPWVAHRSLALGERKRKVLLMVAPGLQISLCPTRKMSELRLTRYPRRYSYFIW